MKLLFLFLLVLPFFSIAQVELKEAPEELQLYPRDQNNTAKVWIKGKRVDSKYTSVKLEVYEESSLIHTLVENQETFEFGIPIFAKPVEYKFVLTAEGSSSKKVLERSGIVCGDVFLLYGQSNMAATTGLHIAEQTIDTRLLRNYDFVDVYKREETQFYRSLKPYVATGMIGIELQRLLLENEGIPSLVINASVGGADIIYLQKGGKGYTELLKRVQGAKVIGKIKAMVWRQGETETCNWLPSIEAYPENFNKLYNQLSIDVGPFEKIYNIQLPLLTCNKLEAAGFLRDFMRRTQYIYPNIKVLNALGLSQVDNLHHGYEAYVQTANELFNMMKFDLYGKGQFENYFPPEIKTIKLNNSNTILELEFDQEVVFPEMKIIDGKHWILEEYFYVNTETVTNDYIVEKGWAEKNTVFLKLRKPINEGFVSYLPSFTMSEPPNHQAYLFGKSGLRANAFYKVPISNVSPHVTFKELSESSVSFGKTHYLTISGQNLNEVYSLEVKLDNETSYLNIVNRTNNSITFQVPEGLKPGLYPIVYNYLKNSQLSFSVEEKLIVNDIIISGSKVIIKGSGFGNLQGSLFIDDQSQDIQSWSDSSIEIEIKSDLSIDWHNVTIKTRDGNLSIVKEYFGVDVVLSKENELDIIVYPNPLIGEKLFIKNLVGELKNVYLIQQNGKSIELEFNSLKSGEYQIMRNSDWIEAFNYLKLVTTKHTYIHKIFTP